MFEFLGDMLLLEPNATELRVRMLEEARRCPEAGM